MIKPSHPQKPDGYVKRRCHRCAGSGRAPCPICNGSGQVTTGRDVFGKATYSNCSGCFGARTRRCGFCNGEGFA